VRLRAVACGCLQMKRKGLIAPHSFLFYESYELPAAADFPAAANLEFVIFGKRRGPKLFWLEDFGKPILGQSNFEKQDIPMINSFMF
jgi:hypothetical protein